MSDMTLKQDILDELEFEPSIDAADIGVAVENGTVTLSGHVRSYSERQAAEDAVKRVKGVRAIAQEIEVRPVGTAVTADDEIAKRIVRLLDWNTSVPAGTVQVRVSKGWVTLTGKVEWNYQRQAAAKAVHNLPGVSGIRNLIEILPAVSSTDVRSRIEGALKRDAELEAMSIRVQVKDNAVTLDGKVHSWSERRAAERAAWSARGVKTVTDNLVVSA
jgi:osmotically-inducible protein OsmY